MGRQDKTERQALKERIDGARSYVLGERNRLRERIDEMRVGCADAPRHALERIRARFLSVGQQLQATGLDPDGQLFDARFVKRVENTAKAGCRLRQREARVEAEPAIRAGKAAHSEHLGKKKDAQKKAKEQRVTHAKIPRGAARKAAEEEVLRELESDPTTATLVPIWKRERAAMFKRAAEAKVETSPLEAFLAWVDENFEAVKAEIDKRAAGGSKKGGKKGKAAAPASGARASRHGTGPSTVASPSRAAAG